MTRSDPDSAPARLFGAVVQPLQAFLRTQAAGGVVLLACALGALVWANVDARGHHAFFALPITVGAGEWVARFSLEALINDGLMALFFFVVGLEIKRELAVGELSTVPKAILPAIAALGGMVVPAGIYLAFNAGGPGAPGWAIPMATDIAFCIGILALLGDRVPRALVVFLTALAIFDDIGGILVIAFFYGSGISAAWLAGAAGFTLLLFVMGRAYVTNALAYAAAGLGLWLTLHEGGIHPTIAGVIAGLMVPARPPRSSHELRVPLHRFEHALHPYVALGIMPLFALANSGVAITGDGAGLAGPVALGTAAGLLAGKPLGIFVLTLLAVKLRIAPMPGGAGPRALLGVSVLAGIGFTVALFIAALAFGAVPPLLAEAKAGILAGSFAAGLTGFLLLRGGARPATRDPGPAM